MNVYTCDDHDKKYIPGVSVIVAPDEATARILLDERLKDTGLKTSADSPYTLVRVSTDEARVAVYSDGDY